jgi:hypothetical protein
MKNLVKLLLIAFVVLTAGNLFAQYATSVTKFPFVNGPAQDVAPQCVGGLIYDDGTWENGYGWNPGFGTGKWVQKFTPPSYPYTVNQFCIALTRLSSGSASWTFDIEVWDTTGAGGAPGTLVTSITNQTATGIPLWTTVQWFDFTNISTIPALTSGSYYIGISYTPTASQYVGADESSTTPLRPCYGYIQSAWALVTTYFPSNRAMGIRVDGTGQVLAHDIAVGPFLSLPPQFVNGTSYNIKARVRNLGSSNETGIPLKLFVDGVQSGSTVNMNLNAGVTDSVSLPWVAQSGNHTLKVIASLGTDLNRNNDTVTTSVTVLAGNTYTQQQTLCRNGLNKTLNDYSWVYDTVTVSIPGGAFGIADVNVKVDTMFHSWDSDVRWYLWHSGMGQMINGSVGGSGDNFIGTLLNDSATTPLASGTAPFTGSFIPSNPLSIFNGYGNNPAGAWIFAASDSAGGDTGLLKAWCLIVSYYNYTGNIQTITVPNYYALGQNYPNPFNPSTKIQYAIPRAGDVSIVVYDIVGRQVATLVNEFKNPGLYTADFNASSLASGVYFYRIKAGDFTDTKKILLVK